MNDVHKIFIGGTGRCGTNLLKDVLVTDENACGLPFESRISTDPFGLYESALRLGSSCSPFVESQVVTDLFRFLRAAGQEQAVFNGGYYDWELSEHFSYYYESVDDLESKLIVGSYEATWPIDSEHKRRYVLSDDAGHLIMKFTQTLFDQYAVDRSRNVYVDDNTYNICYSDLITEHMSNCHLIHMVRDPRDVVASLMGQRWMPDDIDAACSVYLKFARQFLMASEGNNDGKVLRIRLEDLCTRPSDVYRDISSFCGINFKPKPFDFGYANSGRWKRDCSKADQLKLTSRLASVLRTLNYNF
ncbi:sulfotransferase [Luminiphilus sp.]|nr:sulfotransferase [Luminiphilus sp.]